MKRSISLLLALVMIASLAIALPHPARAAELPFTDVPAGTWYTDAVSYVYGKGWIDGTSPSTFEPETNLSRAQLVTILWRIAGKPAVSGALPYTDVAADTWYTEAVRWAAAEKLTDRENGEFQPGDALMRDETALLLWNAAKYLGADVSVGAGTSLLGYDDASMIRAGYAPAMQWAIGAGVINGIGDGLLAPTYWLSRAQAAVMLRRFAAALHAASPLSLWTEDAPAAETLSAYIKAVTDFLIDNTMAACEKADQIFALVRESL